jgi:hypothetical protein
MDVEELADRSVPDAGLGPKGGRHFSAGGLSLEGRMDAEGTLRLLWPDGSLRRRLPPTSLDLAEPDFLNLCRQYREARRTLREAIDLLATRFRDQLANGYSRSVALFRELVVDHPVTGILARQMVWATEPAEGNPSVTFRPTEDGSFIDAHGTTAKLPDTGRIRAAATVGMAQAESSAWKEHLLDHGILQMVPQFSRIACRPMPQELPAVSIDRFSACEVTSEALRHRLRSEGWSHDKPQETGEFTRHFREFVAAALFACVRHTRVGSGGWASKSPAAILEVFFVPSETPKKDWRKPGVRIRMRDVPPEVFSTVVSMLHVLTGLPPPEQVCSPAEPR